MNCYLGLDLGTSNIKGVLTDERMNVLADAAVSSPMKSDGPKREMEPEELIDRVFGVIRKLTAAYDGPASDIKAVSTASASGNTLFLDARDEPLYNVLSWTDRRIEGKTPDYLPGFETDAVYDRVGWPYLEIFPLAHIAWLKKDRPELFARLGRIVMSTEYLQFRLTGRWGIEPSAATTFYLQDQSTFRYAGDYLDYFGITEDQLPPILPERTPLGTILPDACARTGLSPETKFVLGSFDHPACARALGALDEGNLLLSCGTSWAGLFVTKKRSEAIRGGMIIDPYLREEGNWAAIFAFTQFGEFIDARVGEFIEEGPAKFDRFGALTQNAMDREKAVYVPITDAGACQKGWSGLDKRSVAESIIYSTCVDVRNRIRELDAAGFHAERIFMAGGPSRNPVWTQTMADVIERPVYRLHREFCGAVGAALMASIGDGRYQNERDFFQNKTHDYSVCEPKP